MVLLNYKEGNGKTSLEKLLTKLSERKPIMLALLDSFLAIASGPSYLNLFVFFIFKLLLFIPALLGMAMLFATETVLPKAIGGLLLLFVIVSSLFLLVVNGYAAYTLYMKGLDGFLEVLLLVLYVLSALAPIKLSFESSRS